MRPQIEAIDAVGGHRAGADRAALCGGGAGEPADPKYVICNADESEPGTFKDREILRDLPHLVIEGMVLAAYCVGAERGWVFIRHEYGPERKKLESAIAETSGRKLPLNVDGAIAAVLTDLGIAPALANAFFMIARLPGLVAQAHEEQTRERPMRKIDPTAVSYDGPALRHLRTI